MQTSKVRRSGALLVGLALVVAACGDDSKGATETTAAASTTAAVVETTAAPAPETTGAPTSGGELQGMKGSAPLPPDLSQDFKDRLATVPSGADLKDFAYSAETYDAVIVIALAA